MPIPATIDLSDWLADAGLRKCSIAARGLYADLLAFMSANGGAVDLGTDPPTTLAAISGIDEADAALLLEELHGAGVVLWWAELPENDRAILERRKQNEANRTGFSTESKLVSKKLIHVLTQRARLSAVRAVSGSKGGAKQKAKSSSTGNGVGGAGGGSSSSSTSKMNPKLHHPRASRRSKTAEPEVANLRQSIADLYRQISGGSRRFDPRGTGTRSMLDPLIRERLELNGRDSEKVLVEFRTALRVFAGRYIGQHTHDGRSLTKYYRPATVFRKLKFEEALREAEHDAPRPTAVSTRALEKTRGLEDPEEQ